MMYAYHLLFHDPVHFGMEGIGQESIEQTLRSDSLWGAVLQKWFLLFDDEPDALCCRPPFSVSSCFPLISGVRFLPLPIGALDAVIEEAAKKVETSGKPTLKDWRRVKYLAEPLFREIIAGKQLRIDDIDLQQVYPMDLLDKDKPFLPIFQKQEQRPRIRTDQLNGGVDEGSFFYCTDQFFVQDSGLFFLASFDDRAAGDKFDAALRLLGDCGVGADRSTGRGGFSITRQQFALPSDDTPTAWLSISLYHPTREDVKKGVLSGSSRYSLVKRSGPGGSFHVSRYRRADCWMLEEGSVLPFKVTGDTPCVLRKSEIIPHNIYRNGRAFCIPFQGGGAL